MRTDLSEGRGSEIARQCWEEMIGRAKEGKVRSEWEEERRKFFEERGEDLRTVKIRRKEGGIDMEQLIKKDRE